MTEGQSLISSDVLALRGDAARDVAGVHGLVGSARHRHDGVKVARDEGSLGVELHLSLEWERTRNRRRRGAGAGGGGARADGGRKPDSIDVVVDEWHSASSA